MTRSLHIGLMTPAWPGVATANGIATAIYHLAQGLSDIGHRPIILTERLDGPMPEDASMAPPVIEIERKWRLSDKLMARFFATNAVHRVIESGIIAAAQQARKDHGLDVLVLEESFGRGAAVNAGLEIPVVAALHGPWALLCATSAAPLTKADHMRIAREEQSFAKMSGLLAPSASAMDIARAASGTKALPQAIIPNPIPRGAPLEPSARETSRILFVGRFDTVKGGDTVIEAFGKLHAACPEARLTFVGPDRGCTQADGSLLQIAAAIEALPDATRDAITYMGPLPRSEIEDLRRQHPIALLASRYEVFAYTMAEAMAAGQALVCTDVGGPREYQRHEETALMIPAGDANAMAAELQRLLQDSSLQTRLAENGFKLLETRLSPRAVATQTIDFLTPLLESPQ